MSSASLRTAPPSGERAVDEAVHRVQSHARELAQLRPSQKAALLRECIPRVMAEAADWVASGARARDAAPAEEWLGGIIPTVRYFRLLAESLDAIARHGRPPLGRNVTVRPDGRTEIDVFPASAIDGLTFQGFTGTVVMQEGVTPSEARERQAAFHQERDPEGGVSAILGAGNVSSIPPMDVATKMFIEGHACVLKMNPVNEWVGPHLERALQPLIRRGYLAILYGGGDVGAHLAHHPDVADVHITGSNHTHDLIVWGTPGPERDRRLEHDDPLLTVPITSELGNVSPVAVVPYHYNDDELWFMARNVATMVWNNGSFNCNAAKMLITAAEWPQRDRFLTLVGRALGEAPARRAYYPGAFDRYRTLLAGRDVERFGAGDDERLAWAFVRGLDPDDPSEPLFTTEPFCGILAETALGGDDPVEFLDLATHFMNERLWGTLNATLMVHPRHEEDDIIETAVERAILDLRYGTVAVNHWPALGYAFCSTPWGGHPSATLRDIQSGLGWVHNSYMLDGIEKVVIRGPRVVKPHPTWFYDSPNAEKLAPAAADMEARPSLLKLPGLLAKALR
jgi:acyl-CoA reductase-like NAD-dependent aldehyde dehydrogenase